jgi:hypothetical protein
LMLAAVGVGHGVGWSEPSDDSPSMREPVVPLGATDGLC